MSKDKTLEAYTGEARNAVLEFKKLVAAFCGVDVKDVSITVEVKRDDRRAELCRVAAGGKARP